MFWKKDYIRIIAATNRDLNSKSFRRDLYHRLNVISIKTPPLRERREDIPALARHFLRKYSKKAGRVVRGISPDAEAMLRTYYWPGNVGELQNVIERAVLLGSSETLVPDDLPADLLESTGTVSNYHQALNALKRELLEKAFAMAEGNYKKAAALLGLYPTYVYRLLENLKLTHLLKA